VAVAAILLAVSGGAAPIEFGFETGKIAPWTVVEGSFGMLVCDRAEYHHSGGAYSKKGTYFLSTLESPQYKPDDRYTGTVLSPVFVLAGPKVSLMVGGGKWSDTYVALCTLDAKEQRQARGDNAQKMAVRTWDVQEFVGKPVYLKVVDHRTTGWGHVTLDDVRAEGTIDLAATEQVRAHLAEEAARQALAQSLADIRLPELARGIQARTRQFPEWSATGQSMAREAAGLADDLAGLRERTTPLTGLATRAQALRAATTDLRRRFLLSHPALRGLRILYVRRQQYASDHHNTATIFQTGEINTGKFHGPSALRVLDVASGQATTLLDCPGVVRDPDVHFSGQRLLFAMRHTKDEDYHIYEIQADGSGLRQLTGAPGVADIDPLYLPDGDIAFSSTREPKYCMCNRHIMCNLFRMEADGANIHQIGKSTLFEGHGSLLPDGRILYDRWEYVDRNFGDAQGLWTVNPDGTNHAVYWGNNTPSPGAVLDARILPDGQRIVCTLSSCHDRPWGALGIIDRRVGIDGPTPIVHTWPASARNLAGRGNYDMFKGVRPRYEDPYPLTDDLFLCTRTLDSGNGEETGIFVVDTLGNEALLQRDAPGCFDPMPLAARSRPPAIPARRGYADPTGQLYVNDVYQGSHMAGVKRGEVKYLRVVASPEKRFWTHPSWGGQGVHCPAVNWHSFEVKRVLGTVPVEADGSAHFEVPADTFVYFQLLDKDGMMIQSMRSGTMVQADETTGCVGCHERRLEAPPPVANAIPAAVARKASALTGWHGKPRNFSFPAEVQPVFDRHCVRCHDFGKPAGEKLLLAGDREITFNASYVDLWRKKVVRCIGGGPAETQPARSWGSSASPLVQILRKGHKGVELSPEEFDRIVTWIDVNGPYYPTYASAYPANLTGRCPLDNAQLKRLGELSKTPFASLAAFNRKQRVNVSFDRPELSPCLSRLPDTTSAEYQEAVAILRAGGEMLTKRPRGDMPGFQECPVDQKRDEKYAAREREEARCRAAIVNGGKAYDPRPKAEKR
jgi:hypothetical protein